MNLRAEQLEAHLANAQARANGSLAPLYAIHGDEPLLALEAADALRAAARKRGYAEREVLIVERGFDWSALTHAGASLSLFGTNKIVELRIPGGKPGTEGAQSIVQYCETLNPQNLTLVTLPRLDRAGQNSAWFGALARAGVVVDVFPVERSKLPAWIGERLARQGQRGSREALELIAERVEGNLLAAHQEVQKLALLAPPGEIGVDEVRDAVASVARYDAYAAGEALLAGDLARYVRVIEGLRDEGEAPTFVLWAVTEDLRALARIRRGVDDGRALDALLRENRVWGPRQATIRAALRRYPPDALDRAIAHASKIDRAIKGVYRARPWEEFVKLGLRLTHGSEAGRRYA